MDEDRQTELMHLDERLHIVRAMLLGLQRSTELLLLMTTSTGADAVARLVSEFEVDEQQAVAILDLHVRHFATDFVQRLADEAVELEGARSRIERGEDAQ